MVTTPINLSFQDYLVYDDGTDNNYELVDGELVMVPLPTADHSDVIDLLSNIFQSEISKTHRDWLVKRDVGVYIGINPQTGKERSRTPDLCVVNQGDWSLLKADKKAAAVLKTPPLLVVEIVSPSSRKTDYKSKQTEYESRGIPEYWIVDLCQLKVSVLWLIKGRYQIREFSSNQTIVSQSFPKLKLTAQRLFSG
jgi:Uma2 family endonuclease